MIDDHFHHQAVILARHEGEAFGDEMGFQRGRQAGYDSGYRDGDAAGYARGWDEGIALANVEILKQMEFTRQHIAAKQQMSAQIHEQHQLIAQLADYRKDLERENASLKTLNQRLKNTVNALENDKKRLKT